MQSTAQNLERTGRTLSTAVTLPIVAGATAVRKFGLDFEHALTGVRKTVEGTPEELAQLQKELIALSANPAAGGKSAEELAGIAEVAGSLGIPIGNITELTRVIAGLGVTTGLPTEQL